MKNIRIAVVAVVGLLLVSSIAFKQVKGSSPGESERATPPGPGAMTTIELGGVAGSTTAFGVALLNGKRDDVKALLEDGVDINEEIPIQTGEDPILMYPPLTLAAQRILPDGSSADFVQFLIDKGADVNAKAEGGLLTALHFPLMSGREDVARVLVTAGADVNVRDNDGHNLALRLAQERCPAVVPLLREHGATE